MNRTFAILTGFFVASGVSGFAQQIPYNSQYIVNSYSLSPAYAGTSSDFEAFASYRNNWVGVDGAPVSRSFMTNGSLNEKMGLGGVIRSEEQGVFQQLSVMATYAYHLKIISGHHLGFGLSGGIFENHINLARSKSQAQLDPSVISSQDTRGITADADFGVQYNFRNLKAGITVLHLIPSSIKNNIGGQEAAYSLKRHYLLNASWNFYVNQDWQIEPYAIVRSTERSPFFYEVTAVGKYKEQLWAGLTYRKQNGMGMALGGELYGMFVLNYAYEFGGAGMLSASSGSHEITVGYFFGKMKKARTAPRSSPNRPYYDWINK